MKNSVLADVRMLINECRKRRIEPKFAYMPKLLFDKLAYELCVSADSTDELRVVGVLCRWSHDVPAEKIYVTQEEIKHG